MTLTRLLNILNCQWTDFVLIKAKEQHTHECGKDLLWCLNDKFTYLYNKNELLITRADEFNEINSNFVPE